MVDTTYTLEKPSRFIWAGIRCYFSVNGDGCTYNCGYRLFTEVGI